MKDFQKEMARGRRIAALFMMLPLLVIVGIFVGGRVPPRWRNLWFLFVAAGATSIIFAIPIREALRQERKAGLVPKRAGFSGKLELIAGKLRARANELDEDDEELGAGASLTRYIAEVRRVALAQDRYELLPGVDLQNADAATLRRAASEVERYAQNVRGRGSIFKLSLPQLFAGGALILAAFVWGWRLMIVYWSTPSWTFFGGAALVAASVVLAVGLIQSQRDAA